MQTDIHTSTDVREYDVVDRAITDSTSHDTRSETIYDETIIDNRSVVKDDLTRIDKTTIIDERRPKDGGPKKPQKTVTKEQCICEICTCG